MRNNLLVRTWVFVVAASAAAAGFILALVATGHRVGSPYAVAGIAIVALVAERGHIRLTPTIEASTAALPFSFAAIIAGPLAAAIVGSFGLLLDFGRRDDANPHLRWLSWTATRVLCAASAGVVAQRIIATYSPSLLVLLAAAAAACAVEATVDLAVCSGLFVVRKKGPARQVWRTLGPLRLVSVPLYAPVLALLAYAYLVVSPWVAALFLGPAFALQRLFLLYRQQQDATAGLKAANDRLESVNFSFASALVATLDARDQYTAGHSAAVAIYARDIAAAMGLPESQQRLAHLCGMVHDVGKIGLAPGILEKPGALTSEERRLMEEHPHIGERILAKVDDYAEIAAIVRHHHERIDGGGYPDRLRDDDIPLLAKVISVADAYNAMTSDRPYRQAMPTEVARGRLRESAGSQFDPIIVEAFDTVLDQRPESYRCGKSPEFQLEPLTTAPRLLRAA